MTRLRILPLVFALILAACSGDNADLDGPEQSVYFAASDQIIDLDGQTIRYRESGPSDAPSIVMLHGFTDSLHTWDALVDALDDDFHILRPDIPGHGLSGPSPDGDYSNEALVDFVGAFLDATGTQDAILVGNSLGGLAAWRYAAGSDAVRGLVLLAPGGVPYADIGEEPSQVPTLMKLFLKSAPEVGVRQMLNSLHAEPSLVRDEMVTRYRDLMRVEGNGDAFVERAAQFAFPAPESTMARVSAPTIVIWGAQDVILASQQAEVFRANIPQIEVNILENVGHMPQAEATDRVADAIRRLATATGE